MAKPLLLDETLPSELSANDDTAPDGIAPLLTGTNPSWLLMDSADSKSGDESALPATHSGPNRFIKHYEIIRKIGQGGMGSVFLARDRRLGRLVAVKILHHEEQSPARLLAEARATARARHDNIIVIYEIGMDEGRPYLVLEYLSGQTLRKALSESIIEAGRTLPRGFALDVIVSVVHALSAAHKNGIIHRDLKPENIMLLDSGQVKVLDFGLAQRITAAGRGKTVGTFAYMSPEQWLGHHVDERCDIWAVGMVLFEVLFGAHPLAATKARGFSTIADLDAPMPRLRDVCPDVGGLSDVVERCLRKRKQERFVSADELLTALESLQVRPAMVAPREHQSPFAGLAAFQESDADCFYGRERDMTMMIGWLGRHALVCVAGSSGAGKSSFVRAGVIPALKRSGENWDILYVRPGRSPLLALKEALDPEIIEGDLRNEPGGFGTCLRARCRARGATQRIAIFVDQFEEIFTLGSDPKERSAFLACLMGAADDASSPLRVIIAIRSDFLERVVEDRAFLDRLRQGLFFLPPVAQEGLRDALKRPLESSGYRFEDESMITDMLSELSAAKCPLPLLQFSASACWEKRDREKKLLTRQSYEKLGGVVGALSTHAEAVIAGLSATEQRICRAIVLRLVTPERTRAITNMNELRDAGADASLVESIVQQLCAARLLLLDSEGESGTTIVELVHESLIERWPSLSRWLDESADDARFLARLRAAAAQWRTEGEPSGLLWRDRAADEARGWYERRKSLERGNRELLGEREERYLEAVIAFHVRSRRTRKRLMAVALAFVSVIAFTVSFLAWLERAQAKRADEEAARVRDQNKTLALQAIEGRNAKRMLAAHKNSEDPTLIMAILREIEPPEVPRDWPELVSGALTSGVATHVRRFGQSPIYMVEVSPDGTRIALAMHDKVVQILGADDFQDKIVLRGHESYVGGAQWSNDGKHIVTVSGDKTARVWNADGSGDALVLRGHTADINAADFSPDGERVMTASEDGTVRLWTTRDGNELSVTRHDLATLDARFSPDGRRRAIAVGEIVRVTQFDGQGAPLLLRGHTGQIVKLAWSPDGARIVTASQDKTVRIWNASNGAELLVLRGHEDKIMSVAWSHDGQRIASASKDKTVRVWNVDGNGEPLILRGHQHWVYAVSFSRDNRTLFTSSLDRTVRSWDIDAVVTPVVLRGHEDLVGFFVFSPDGQRIATSSSDQTIRVWNADGHGNRLVFRGHTAQLGTLSWSPDGTRIVSSSMDGTARIWFVEESRPPIVLQGRKGPLAHTTWSSDGQHIVTAAYAGHLQLWSADGNELAMMQTFAVDPRASMIAQFDPSGSVVAVHDSEHAFLRLWYLDQPDKLVTLGSHDGGIGQAEWSPDGSRILTQCQGVVRVWDVHGRQAPVVFQEVSSIGRADWSPDGHRISLQCEDGLIRIRNAEGGGDSNVVGQYGLPLSWLDWHRDGRRIITATVEGAAHVWNADGSGLPFVFHASQVRAGLVRASPSGGQIGVRTDEKVTRIWPDVRPFSGPNDKRLWTSTRYCIPPEKRIELFGVTEAQARQQEEECRRRVDEVRASR